MDRLPLPPSRPAHPSSARRGGERPDEPNEAKGEDGGEEEDDLALRDVRVGPVVGRWTIGVWDGFEGFLGKERGLEGFRRVHGRRLGGDGERRRGFDMLSGKVTFS
jgi:hypothetical protein